jgi:hypothetical protein
MAILYRHNAYVLNHLCPGLKREKSRDLQRGGRTHIRIGSFSLALRMQRSTIYLTSEQWAVLNPPHRALALTEFMDCRPHIRL